MKVVVIGASRGLGLELTKRLLAEGHIVAAGYRKQPSIELQELKSNHEKLLLFPSDVRSEQEIKAGAALCKTHYDEVDVVCNVSGILLPGDRKNLIHECDIDELRETFDVNTIGAIIVAKYFYPIVKKRGKLITITSEGTAIKNCGTWVLAMVYLKQLQLRFLVCLIRL